MTTTTPVRIGTNAFRKTWPKRTRSSESPSRAPSDIFFADLFQENRSVPAQPAPDPGDQADQDRKEDELNRGEAVVVSGDGDEPQDLAEEVLTADDVEERRDRHHRHRDDHPQKSI